MDEVPVAFYCRSLPNFVGSHTVFMYVYIMEYSEVAFL